MNKDIKTLTGLRGISALIVMLYHFLSLDACCQNYVPALIKRGYLGVDVFFVLSGFVMALNYARFFKDGITTSSYTAFMVKRLARIYPLYIVITLLFLPHYDFSGLRGVWAVDAHLADFIACVFMIQAWGFGFANIAAATWSLSAEFFAYIIFPFTVFFAVYARPAYAWGLFALAAVFLYIVASSHLGIVGPMDVVSLSSALPVLRCLAGFFLGLIGYRLSQVNACRTFLSSSTALIVLITGFLLALHFKAHDVIVFAFFLPILLALFYESACARLIFANRAADHLGVISYSLYLAHPLFMPVKTNLETIAARHDLGAITHLLIFIFVILLSWGSACLLYRFIEMPGRLYVQYLFRRRITHLPALPEVKPELLPTVTVDDQPSRL